MAARLWRWLSYALAALLTVAVAAFSWANRRADRAEDQLDAYQRAATQAELKTHRRINSARAQLSAEQARRRVDEQKRLEAGQRDHLDNQW